MRALSVRQPWAWSLIFGPKRIENRSWATRHRGPLSIHAGTSRRDLGQEGRRMPGLPPYDELAYGCLLGVVDLVDVVPLAEVAGDPFASGPWCWITANPRPVEPIPYAGRLGLFEVPDALVRLLDVAGIATA